MKVSLHLIDLVSAGSAFQTAGPDNIDVIVRYPFWDT